MKHLKLIQNSKFKIQNSRKGFTLIEILVVVFVLGIGLIGALSFFNINLNNQFESKNELIAAGLAQEGADLVRNKVDFEKLQEKSWATIVSDLTACGRIDYNSLTGTHPCNNGGSVFVCLLGGRYQQCASDPSDGMKRTLSIAYNNIESSLKVVCTVSWNGRTTTATDILYNNSY